MKKDWMFLPKLYAFPFDSTTFETCRLNSWNCNDYNEFWSLPLGMCVNLEILVKD